MIFAQGTDAGPPGSFLAILGMAFWYALSSRGASVGGILDYGLSPCRTGGAPGRFPLSKN